MNHLLITATYVKPASAKHSYFGTLAAVCYMLAMIALLVLV